MREPLSINSAAAVKSSITQLLNTRYTSGFETTSTNGPRCGKGRLECLGENLPERTETQILTKVCSDRPDRFSLFPSARKLGDDT
jgi:hypothetical protein